MLAGGPHAITFFMLKQHRKSTYIALISYVRSLGAPLRMNYPSYKPEVIEFPTKTPELSAITVVAPGLVCVRPKLLFCADLSWTFCLDCFA